jgi:hypothetical protein
MFQKLLNISSAATKYINPGKITNLVFINTIDILMFFNWLALSLTSPFIVLGACVYIIWSLGWIGLVGPALLLISAILTSEIQR